MTVLVFPPATWGPSAWLLIHLAALRFPDRPTAEDRRRFSAFLKSLQHVLPCDGCCKGFQKILEITNFGPATLRSRDTLFEWTVIAHNMVNQKTGKPVRDDWRAWKAKYSALAM